MIIVFVADLDFKAGTPLTERVLAYRSLLEKAGHEVRLISHGDSTSPFSLPGRRSFPICLGAKKSGVCLAKPKTDILQSALLGADLLHVFLPFQTGKVALALARQNKIPVIFDYPLSSRAFLKLLPLPSWNWLQHFCATLFRSSVYFRFKHIIVPDQGIAQELASWQYDQALHIFDPKTETESSEKLEKIYDQAIKAENLGYEENNHPVFKRNWALWPSSIDLSDPYKKPNPVLKVWRHFTYGVIIGSALVINKLINGLKIRGYHNRKGVKGAITVTNHIHNLDSTMLGAAMIPYHVTFTSIEGNFRLPMVRWILKWADAVPIPTSTHLLRSFFDQTIHELKTGRKVHFFPEGSLSPFNNGLRPFKKGAFRMAAEANVPVLPAVLNQRPARGIRKLLGVKWLYHLEILPAEYPDSQLKGAKKVDDLRDRVFQAMNQAMKAYQEKVYSHPDKSLPESVTFKTTAKTKIKSEGQS